MKNGLIVLFLAMAFPMGEALAGNTFYYNYHGNTCVPVSSSMAIEYSQWGPYNPSTTMLLTVSCPIDVRNYNFTEGYIGISGYNRSSAYKLSCRMRATTEAGMSPATGTATLPQNSQGLQYGTARVMPPSYPRFYVHCDIPPATANGVSHLTTVYMSVTY